MSKVTQSSELHRRLDAILTTLVDVLGPAYTPEEANVVIRLTHDRGMRLRAQLRAACPGWAVDPCWDQLSAEPKSDNGRHIYTIAIGSVQIEWPARRVTLGVGYYRYM